MKKALVVCCSYRRKSISFAIVMVLLFTLLCGCRTKEYAKNDKLDTSENVHLVVAGGMKDFPAMEMMIQEFSDVYPNCKIEYEYLQNSGETLPKRLTSKEDRVDLFLTSNIQEGSDNMQYALDLLEQEELDLKDTYPGLIENYKYVGSDKQVHLYSIPLGGEMRGLFVNTTLLSSLGIEVPTNRSELLQACTTIRDAGYVPFQDNPGSFAQRLVFPEMARIIVNTDTNTKQAISNCEEGVANLFEDPMRLIYDLTVEKYYNYKYVETEYNRFIDISDEGMARSFLNITGENGEYEKADDLGAVAFMTSADSLKTVIDKVKKDYHSKIEYQFILAPITEQGGIAYMSPTNGLAINNASDHIDWCLEFLNFFFYSEHNKQFAKEYNITPNTTDAIDRISQQYGIPKSEIGEPADVTFTYNFFKVVNPVLIDTSKGNNPKYMKDNGDGTYSMYDFSHYMDLLKTAFEEQRILLIVSNKL